MEVNGLHSVVEYLTRPQVEMPPDWIVSDRQAAKDDRAIAYVCQRDGHVTSITLAQHMGVIAHFAGRKLRAAEARGLLTRERPIANKAVIFKMKKGRT